MEDNNEGKTFEVSVHDSVGISELHPGTNKPEEGETREPTPEEIKQIVLERKVALDALYVKPHNKKSRFVQPEDVKRVMEDGKILHEMCMVGRGDYTDAFAMHHSQINDTDPLNYYVTQNGEFFINPEIISTGGNFIMEKEGCMTFPEEPMKSMTRYEKVRLKYQTLINDGELSTPRMENYKGILARVVQHEIAHGLAHYIYDETASVTDCLNKK